MGKNSNKNQQKGNKKAAAKPAAKPGKSNAPVVATTQSELITVNLKFHPDSNGGHHHIIVENLGDKHVSVGVTTKKKYDKKHNNIPLDHSPLSNGQKSYALRKGTVDIKKNYNSPKQGEITTEDAAKVKTIAYKAKEKEIKKNKR